MVRAIVLYDEEPDTARYEQHVELCRKVPGATFRHGKVFGAPMGEPQYRYYAARARRTGDLHGQAPLLWAATELLR